MDKESNIVSADFILHRTRETSERTILTFSVTHAIPSISCHEDDFLLRGCQIFIGACLSNIRAEQKVLEDLMIFTIAAPTSGYVSSFLQTFLTRDETSTKPFDYPPGGVSQLVS